MHYIKLAETFARWPHYSLKKFNDLSKDFRIFFQNYLSNVLSCDQRQST